MKLKVWITSLLAGVLSGWNTGYSVQRSDMGITVPQVVLLTPDTLSNVRVETLLQIPERTLSRRCRLIFQPMLVQEGHPAEPLPIRVFDAPIQSRKMARRLYFDHCPDTLASAVRLVNPSRRIEIPYAATVEVPANGNGGQIVARLSIHACNRCRKVDTIELARIFDPSSLFSDATLQLADIESHYVVRPKIGRGHGEARLRFPINRYDIDMRLGNNRREMESMLAALQRVVDDSLTRLETLSIEGLASADGPCAGNLVLARRRAEAALAWLVGQQVITPAQTRKTRIEARPEGWKPVLEAMRAEADPDTLALAEILSRHAGENDDAAERDIRRLHSWPAIRDRYLQKDRRVEYEYTYAIRSFTTDRELLHMYDRRPETLNEEEMLRVAVLQPTVAGKKSVYAALLERFPQSYVAANNLARLLIREGRTDEARTLVATQRNASPQLLNTRAVLLSMDGRGREALALLETIDSLPEARYNRGLLLARSNRHEEALALLKEFGTADAALAALAVGRTAEAADIMARSADSTLRGEYIRALIAARQGDVPSLRAHLSHAVREPHLARRARTEPDFAAYAELADFIVPIRSDSEYEAHR